MNLIITCARHLEEEADSEVIKILEKIGDQEPKSTITKMPGIILVDTSIDPFVVTRKIKEIIEEEPWQIRYIMRVIPIERFIETKNEEITNNVQDLIQKIGKEETYRISVKKRHSLISSRQIITEIAIRVKNKVNLENPSWIILIEIFGSKTGVSVLHAQDIVSVEKTKRSLLE
ncbi:MAG: RNA methyltransferase [Nitrosopumilaceae archaeon]|nr:RNA methyltransferase [Nitrosopumilaceae archaeon]NIT99492.1 RNA methyltransferase [Nitrosopumilaceae archaeon]NIU85851.1 RNA methyltransferase [Nitrosopumilaceae archaeon]NIV64708.1 RNA methyltransferase [Nitrosopumilaceae archaeon]NIX60095.1 RNA methyltransferase [Nitrosopumilaceae archaeon]